MIVNAKQILDDDTLAAVAIEATPQAPGALLTIPLADRGVPVRVMVPWGVIRAMVPTAMAEFGPHLMAQPARRQGYGGGR